MFKIIKENLYNNYWKIIIIIIIKGNINIDNNKIWIIIIDYKIVCIK